MSVKLLTYGKLRHRVIAVHLLWFARASSLLSTPCSRRPIEPPALTAACLLGRLGEDQIDEPVAAVNPWGAFTSVVFFCGLESDPASSSSISAAIRRRRSESICLAFLAAVTATLRRCRCCLLRSFRILFDSLCTLHQSQHTSRRNSRNVSFSAFALVRTLAMFCIPSIQRT